jgi:hypothetical protein
MCLDLGLIELKKRRCSRRGMIGVNMHELLKLEGLGLGILDFEACRSRLETSQIMCCHVRGGVESC